jgi:MinD-like ATPase involved in chromosome partitioning or flagellar assembly
LRAPTHRALVGAHPDRDLGAVLAGESRLRDSVWPVRSAFGSYHSIGAREPLSIELLSGEGMRRLLLEARVAYDFVVIDTPSSPLYSDALVLAGPSDCVLSVLRPWHSERKAAEAHLQGISALAQAQAIVINHVPSRRHPAGAPPAARRCEPVRPLHEGTRETPLLGRPISERGR